jgi:hypothetical protein
MNAVVLCLGEKDVIVTYYITFSTSQNYECNEMNSKNTTLLEQFQNQISKS